MGNFFNNGSMTMTLHILKVLYGLESHAKDGRCGLSRNDDIRRFVGKLVEKQTLVVHGCTLYCTSHQGRGRSHQVSVKSFSVKVMKGLSDVWLQQGRECDWFTESMT